MTQVSGMAKGIMARRRKGHEADTGPGPSPGTGARSGLRRAPLMVAAAVMTVLAACAKGPEDKPINLEIGRAVSDYIQQRRASRNAPERPPLTRAGLDDIKDPYIEVTLEDSGIFAYLSQQFTRQDDSPGTVVVWRTEDNVALSLRDGVLVATRGLGNDILSSSALVDGQGPKGPSHSGARRYHIRGLDNGSWQLSMLCQREDLGAVPVTIVELTYPTRHIREHCSPAAPGREGTIINDYWVDSRSGRVWQSRQWAGPNVGYMRIRQLTTGG